MKINREAYRQDLLEAYREGAKQGKDTVKRHAFVNNRVAYRKSKAKEIK